MVCLSVNSVGESVCSAAPVVFSRLKTNTVSRDPPAGHALEAVAGGIGPR
jgi:hypothetical protein